MNQSADFPKHPLPEKLTLRVISYLNAFRVLISLGLLLALFAGFITTPVGENRVEFAYTALISYAIISMILAIQTRRQNARTFLLALITLFTDVFFLSILLALFGGLESGIAILLIFTSASAALILPLRFALMIASLIVLVFIGESLVGLLIWGRTATEMVQAGLYGTTTFIVTILANMLAHWLKDFRLYAQRQVEQVTRLEQVNELVIRRMRSGVLAIDANGRIRLMNESAWFLLGNPTAEKKMLAKVAPQLSTALKKWEENPSVEPLPIKLYGTKSQILPKFVSLPGTASIHVLIFLEDNEVVSQRALEMSAHMLANLSGSIAHEIRNPLAAITTAAQLLNESEEIAEGDLRLVDIIHNQSVRMNGIVENILQLSRHEKSRPDIFDLTPFLEELAVESTSSLPGIRLTLDIDPNQGKLLVLFDRSQLHQALWKLLENALRHAHLDAAIPQVTMTMKRKIGTGYCIISVEDNGPGIPESNMTRIFEPFFTTHKRGSGLGLYIARQLCEVNQAELTVDSILGTCSRFHIRLALARSSQVKAHEK
jgi:two-component system sensor histidine kinase PilS (NtrC family)